MKKIRRYFAFVFSLVGLTHSFGMNNPMPVPLDGAMLRFNGTYYAMSAATNGQMLISDDLVEWREPTQGSNPHHRRSRVAPSFRVQIPQDGLKGEKSFPGPIFQVDHSATFNCPYA